MLSTGFPMDSDPREEEESECPECKGVVVPTGTESAKCVDCGETFEPDGEPEDTSW
jgi:DNA-directed RNA polymerase subunit RPC12/RpoP